MKNTDALAHIRNLGFSLYEAKIILALLETDDPTAKDIAQLSLVPKNKVYEILEKLHSDSVVEVLQTKPKRFKVLNLEVFISQRERAHAAAFRTSSNAIHALIKKKTAHAADSRTIWTTEGSKATLNKIHQILDDVQKESIAFIDVWIESKENYDKIDAAIKRGVKFFFLGPVDTHSKPIIKKYAALGVQVRSFPVNSAGYSIFDTQKVQMRITDNKIISLWIDNKYLAATLREHFFKNWKKAKKVKL